MMRTKREGAQELSMANLSDMESTNITLEVTLINNILVLAACCLGPVICLLNAT
jgi:hypothetical protein